MWNYWNYIAVALSEEKGTTDKVQLKQIQHHEKLVKDYKAVQAVLIKVTEQKRGGGLDKLKTKKNGGTQTIMDPTLMAEVPPNH